MAAVPPPEHPTETPELTGLAKGTVLYRIHGVAHPAETFNPTLSHRYFGGGRFDATTDDAYAYVYAGDTPLSAIAETLLRDLPIDKAGAITIPSVTIAERRVSAVATTADVEVVNLKGLVALRKCSQDPWLVQSGPREYPQTRHWGHWIRSQAPGAAGFVWRSKRDPDAQAFVLFAERCPADFLSDVTSTELPADAQQPFAGAAGRAYLRTILEQVNADVSDPIPSR